MESLYLFAMAHRADMDIPNRRVSEHQFLGRFRKGVPAEWIKALPGYCPFQRTN